MTRSHFLSLSFALLAAAALVNTTAQEAKETGEAENFLVFFGTYTGQKSKGIYVSKLDAKTGKLTPAELAGETISPAFLAVHPNQRFLYAANEIERFASRQSGAISAFTLDPQTGQLSFMNAQASGGTGPCHLVVDKEGKNVLVANYGGGSVAALPIEENGRLKPSSALIQHTGSSVNANRQKEPHAHSINLDAGNQFAAVADLGLDKVLIYKFDAASGSLTTNNPPHATVKAGAGPRHFAFHPNGKHAYVINELNCTVTAFNYDADKGALKEVQTLSTLPKGETVKPSHSTAEVQVHPSGKFLYGSNRGHDSIVVYTIDEKTGKLTYVENEPTQGKIPRNFGIDPTGSFLLAANQNSDTVVVFRIDPKNGALTPTGEKIDVPTPVCVKFVPVP